MTTLFPVAILAGGLASRLQPLTEALPKAMIKIANEPFIAHQLRLLKQKNIQRVVICTGFLSDLLREFVGDGKQFGLQVDYSYDGNTLLGTGGAIKKALPLLGENFFVLYGDSYLPCDYEILQTAFIERQKQILMTVYRNNGQWDKSNVEFANGEILDYHKQQITSRMHHIDYGLGIFNHRAFDHVPHHHYYDLMHVYQHALNQHLLSAFEVTERFYEIGSFQGIADFSKFLEMQTKTSSLTTS